jgi:hypothetical protein
VDNTAGQMRDPFDGVNPFTSIDDGLSAPIVSPLVWELDVVAIPEPSTTGLFALGLVAMLGRKGWWTRMGGPGSQKA